ncbi:AEC family transporter [Leptospira kirschneri]|uniref:AEC family transporter n=1 Tax=Leptospira kirschneri TaxID=29507 RepID=UPI002FC33FFE
MSHLMLIPICLAGGWMLKRVKIFPENSGIVLGNFVVYVSLPSLILSSKIELENSLVFLAFIPWLIFRVSVVFFYVIGKFFHWDSETKIATILCCGLGNTSFLGLPILRMLYGEEVTNSVLIVDQLGTFLCLAVPGFIFALRFQKDSKTNRNPITSVLKKLFTFPPFLALLFSFFLRFFTVSESIHFVLKILGETLVPIALFTVGFQMELGSKLKKSENFIEPLSIGLIYKLLISPIMIFLIYIFLNIDPKYLKIAVLEAGMAPMITASIVSIQMGFKPSLSATFPGIGILCSVPTLFLFYFILENFF